MITSYATKELKYPAKNFFLREEHLSSDGQKEAGEDGSIDTQEKCIRQEQQQCNLKKFGNCN